MLSVVFASPRFEVRKELWKRLEDFTSSVTMPWVLLGDFNEVSNSG